MRCTAVHAVPSGLAPGGSSRIQCPLGLHDRLHGGLLGDPRPDAHAVGLLVMGAVAVLLVRDMRPWRQVAL
eukprot:10396819-Alexandrium_andersonii.AAC.1